MFLFPTSQAQAKCGVRHTVYIPHLLQSIAYLPEKGRKLPMYALCSALYKVFMRGPEVYGSVAELLGYLKGICIGDGSHVLPDSLL